MNRTKFYCLFFLASILSLLAACAARTNFQQSAQDFYSASTSLVSNETNLMNDINQTICSLQRIRNQLKYITNKDYSLQCSPMFSQEEINKRISAFKTLQVYSETLLGMLSSTPQKEIDDNSVTLATTLKKEFNTSNFKLLGMSVDSSSAFAASMSAILGIVVDQKEIGTAVKLANQCKGNLSKFKELILSDAKMIEDFVQTNTKSLTDGQKVLLGYILVDKKATAGQKLDKFNEQYEQNAFGSIKADLNNISAAIDSMIKANDSLAKGDTNSFFAYAKDADNRITDAYSVYKNANK